MSRNPLPRTYFIYQQNFHNVDDALCALANQRKIIGRLCNKYDNSFSALLVLSNVNGDIGERYNIWEAQVGAPKWEYRLKPGEKGTLFQNFHLHIVIVGFYAATASEEFRDIMNANFWKKHPDVRMNGNPFTSEPANGDGLYSKSYFMNQYTNVRYVGDKKRLDIYDRNNPQAVEQHPEYKDELDLLLNQKKVPKPLAKLQQRNTHYINDVRSNNINDNISAGTAEDGTAMGNINIKTSPAITPFVSKTLKRKNYSYSFTPGQNLNAITPTGRETENGNNDNRNIDYTSGLAGTAIVGTTIEVNPEKNLDGCKYRLYNDLYYHEGSHIINPRKLFNPLSEEVDNDEDLVIYDKQCRVYDASPAWMKKPRRPAERIRGEF